MYKGMLGGAEWQSCGLRKNGDRAILWRGDILWMSAAEFQSLLNTEA